MDREMFVGVCILQGCLSLGVMLVVIHCWNDLKMRLTSLRQDAQADARDLEKRDRGNTCGFRYLAGRLAEHCRQAGDIGVDDTPKVVLRAPGSRGMPGQGDHRPGVHMERIPVLRGRYPTDSANGS